MQMFHIHTLKCVGFLTTTKMTTVGPPYPQEFGFGTLCGYPKRDANVPCRKSKAGVQFLEPPAVMCAENLMGEQLKILLAGSALLPSKNQCNHLPMCLEHRLVNGEC